MKNTKIMIGVLLTFFITWMTISFIVFIFSNASFSQIATNPGLGFFMLIFGWIPSVIVGADLDGYVE